MKKAKQRILIIITILVSVLILGIIGILVSVFMMTDEQTLFIDIVNPLMYENDSVANYDESYYESLYNDITEFFASDNYRDALEKEYKYICADDADNAYYRLKAAYAASMLQTHRYDEFKNEIESFKNLSADELKDYYSFIWMFGITLSDVDEHIDYIEIDKIIDKIQYSSYDLQEQNLIFRYYWNLYWNIDMTEDFKNKVIQLSTYSSNRTNYVLVLLINDKYEKFNKLFVADYINYPFDGIDILMLKDDLNKEQLKELDKSLENLKEEFRTKKPKLYEAMEKEKLEILQNNVREKF